MNASSGLTTRQRYLIAGRARTLEERLTGPSNDPAEEATSDTRGTTAERLLDAWQETLPAGVTLWERLDRAGTTVDALRDCVERPRWPADEPLPSWVDTLSAVVARASDPREGDETVAWIRALADDDRPFVDLLAPIAAVAVDSSPAIEVDSSSAVAVDSSSAVDTFGRSASEPLVDWLLDRLEQLCTRSLYVEFRSFLAHHDETLAETEPEAVAEPPTDYYEQFCAAMADGGVRELFVEYPVLGRWVGTVVEQFRAAVTEFRDRLAADRELLAERFGVSGPATAVRPLTEDTHAGGRSPFAVTFETGRVVYKPRPTNGLATLSRVVDRLVDETDLPRIPVPTTVSRDDYGWVEHVASRPVSDEAGVERYYRRAGTLVCLCRVLGLDDIHAENLIAVGNRPTVVDAETILSPAIAPRNVPFDDDTAGVVDGTVAATGLVPATDDDPREDGGGLLASAAGLGGRAAEAVDHGITTTEVVAPNTDLMRARETSVTVGETENTPTLDGEPRLPDDHLDALRAGYERANAAVRRLDEEGELRDTVIEPTVDWTARSRVIYRPTAVYASLLESAVGIEPLGSGLRLSVVFDELVWPFVTDTVESETFRGVCAAERRALRRFDVPRFTARRDETVVRHDGTPTGATADRTGPAALEARLASMDTVDRERQSALLDRCYSEAGWDSTGAVSDTDSECEFVSVATAAFDRLATACLPPESGVDHEQWSASTDPGVARSTELWTAGETWDWTALTAVSSGVNVTPADESLYLGRGGVAVAAAALARLTDADRYEQAARSLLGPVVEWVETTHTPLPLGGTRGVGAVVYALSTAGELLGDDRYHEHATAAASLVDADRVGDDAALDVTDGAAGTALATLAHYRRTGDDPALAAARHCGERLLETQTATTSGAAWAVSGFGEPSTGFAHGSSGIALAAARLAAVTGDDRYERALRRALTFESETWHPTERNWANSPGETPGADRWCWGRSGVALARLGVASALGREPLPGTVDDALAAVADGGPATVDHLCCGTLGRVETLLAGAEREDPPVDRAAAADLAAHVVTRRRSEGVFRLQGHDATVPNPTLYNGLAGVAYTLCRVAAPEELPCLLAFE